MSAFEYLLPFVSILVGLAVADLAASFHRLLRARVRVAWHALPLAAAFLVLLLVLNFWWQFYSVGGSGVWGHYPAFLVLAANLVCMFLLASAALPDEVPAEGTDLGRYYFDNRLYFWGLFALLQLLSTAVGLVPVAARALAGEQIPLPRVASVAVSGLVTAALLLSLGFVRRPAYHYLLVSLLLLGVALQVAGLRVG